VVAQLAASAEKLAQAADRLAEAAARKFQIDEQQDGAFKTLGESLAAATASGEHAEGTNATDLTASEGHADANETDFETRDETEDE